jgi:hypothetical protein
MSRTRPVFLTLFLASAGCDCRGPRLSPVFDAGCVEEVLGFAPESIDGVQRGYSLLFVALLSVIRGDALAINKVARLTRLYLETDFPGDERRAQRVAGELVGALS